MFYLHFLIQSDNGKSLKEHSFWRSDKGFLDPNSGAESQTGLYFSVILFCGEAEAVDRVYPHIHKCFNFWAQVLFSQMLGECGWDARDAILLRARRISYVPNGLSQNSPFWSSLYSSLIAQVM